VGALSLLNEPGRRGQEACIRRKKKRPGMRYAMPSQRELPQWLPVGVIAFAVLARVMPHPWNWTPAGAMFLFCGFVLPGRFGVVFPLAAYIASDLVLNIFWYHTSFAVPSLFVWAGFVLVWLIGRSLRRGALLVWLYPAALAGSAGRHGRPVRGTV